VAFSIALAFDWGWEIAVVPIAWLILAAAILEPTDDGAETRALLSPAPGTPRRVGFAFGGLALALVFVIGTSYVGITKVRASQKEFERGDLEQGIADAKTAEDVQPYAASPLIQHALLLEQQGRPGDAIPLAIEATEKEPTNWRNWLTLSRFQVAVGQGPASVASYKRALALNPRSVLIPTADPRETNPEAFEKEKKG
jgi:hypothetical protein